MGNFLIWKNDVAIVFLSTLINISYCFCQHDIAMRRYDNDKSCKARDIK